MEEAVTNTSSLIFIAKLNIFKLAENIFSKILVPKQVIDELFAKNKPENNFIKKELQNFLKEIEIKNVRDFPLDAGEQAAISLCLEKNVKTFLSDDKKARTYARSLKLETIGTLGILLWNLNHKKITKDDFFVLFKKLIDNGYYLSPNLYSEVMKLIKE